MNAPATPCDAYKAMIDQLVSETRVYGSGSQVAECSVFSNAPDHQEYNAFILTLAPEQRALLARMLPEERDGAIHDVLAVLTWWMTAREVGLTFRGEPMPIELSGMGLHGDYVGRREGWEWPENDDD
jgi:hypothetical protein